RFRVDGSILEAVTMDLSKSGARIFYLSNQIPVNAKVSISCEDILLNGGEAVAVWSKQQEKTYAVSGLRFV
ncbi:MAG: PilZ domain-containing protein, partial [Nitrospinota bacterium]|nr:PilZ domain-containing protein [Nitrospinota bacterium]